MLSDGNAVDGRRRARTRRARTSDAGRGIAGGPCAVARRHQRCRPRCQQGHDQKPVADAEARRRAPRDAARRETVRGLADGSGLRPATACNGLTPDAVAKLVAAPAGAVVVAIEPGLRKEPPPGAPRRSLGRAEILRPGAALAVLGMGLGLRIRRSQALAPDGRRFLENGSSRDLAPPRVVPPTRGSESRRRRGASAAALAHGGVSGGTSETLGATQSHRIPASSMTPAKQSARRVTLRRRWGFPPNRRAVGARWILLGSRRTSTVAAAAAAGSASTLGTSRVEERLGGRGAEVLELDPPRARAAARSTACRPRGDPVRHEFGNSAVLHVGEVRPRSR